VQGLGLGDGRPMGLGGGVMIAALAQHHAEAAQGRDAERADDLGVLGIIEVTVEERQGAAKTRS
jgi:hypothetical protein